MLGINKENKAAGRNSVEKGEIDVIETKSDPHILSLQALLADLKRDYRGTVIEIVNYILCNDEKKRQKHELVATFLEGYQEKDLNPLIVDIAIEARKQMAASTNDNNNNNIEVLPLNLYSFFETCFLFIDQQHKNIASFLVTFEKKVSKFRVFYLLLLELNRVADFYLQNISEAVLINYIAIFAYYDVYETNETLCKKTLINSLSNNEKRNKIIFTQVILKINEYNIDPKFIAVRLNLIATFIEQSWLRKQSLFTADIKKWLREDDLKKIKFDGIDKGVLYQIYKDAITIHHISHSRKASKTKINSPKVERRVKSEEDLRPKKIEAISKIPTFTNISLWNTEKNILEDFIAKLRSIFTIPLFSIHDVRLEEFWKTENNIEDRIRIALQLVENTNDQQFQNTLREYLAIVLHRPLQQLTSRFFSWLQRIKELGFDYQPYCSEHMLNTFTEIEKVNLQRIINQPLVIPDHIIKGLQTAREVWFAEGNEKYMNLLDDILSQIQFKINTDICNAILTLNRIDYTDCLKVKSEKLQQAFDEHKLTKMEARHFILECVLITFKKIAEKYYSDSQDDFFVIKFKDLSEEFRIRLVDYVGRDNSEIVTPITIRNVNAKLQTLVEKGEVIFEKKLLNTLESESEYRLVTYYDQYKLDINRHPFAQAFYDKDKQVVTSTVNLQQVFVDKMNQLVWFKIVNDYLVVEPVDTSYYFSHAKEHFCLFTLSLYGRLFLISHNKRFAKQAIHHSALGEPLIMGGGEANIHDGIFLELTFRTGHYPDFAAACERIVTTLRCYYAISLSCFVYMRDVEAICKAEDRSDTEEELINAERSAPSHLLTLVEFNNLITDPVLRLKKGIFRCMEVFTFFYSVISDNEILFQKYEEFSDERESIEDINFPKVNIKQQKIFIKTRLEELLNEIKMLNIVDEMDTLHNLQIILGKYDFRSDKTNFFIYYLYETLNDVRKNVKYLDYVTYRPERLIKENNLISILYDYLYFVISDLQTELINSGANKNELQNIPEIVNDLVENKASSKIYAYFLERIKNLTANKYVLLLLNELETNPLLLFNKNESLKVQAFRVVLCASLFQYRKKQSEKKLNYDTQVISILDLLKTPDLKIKDFLTQTDELAKGDLRSFLNGNLSLIKTFIGLPTHVKETDILKRLLSEFDFSPNLCI